MEQRKIGFVDVGARGGANPKVAPFADQIQMVLVEPDKEEAARLMASDEGRNAIVIGKALGHVDDFIYLFETENPFCSSALPVNDDVMNQYSIREPHFKFKERHQVECARYDTLYSQGGLPVPHAVKIDVQGFEYQVLEGFGRLLQQCLCIEIETHFYEIYKGQRTFGEMVRFLDAYDFVLRSIRNSRSPHLRGDVHFDGDLIEVDAFFSKKKSWILGQNPGVQSNFILASQTLDIDLYDEFK